MKYLIRFEQPEPKHLEFWGLHVNEGIRKQTVAPIEALVSLLADVPQHSYSARLDLFCNVFVLL